MSDLGFVSKAEDAEGHRGGFEIIEPGWKKVVIVKSEVKPTKAGTGKFLEFTYELQDGTGRSLTDRLNILNPSEVAQKIGRGALSKIALACGHKGELSKTEPLHGRPFEVKVEVEEFESNTEAGKMLKSNKCSDYRPVQTASAAPAGAAKSPVGW